MSGATSHWINLVGGKLRSPAMYELSMLHWQPQNIYKLQIQRPRSLHQLQLLFLPVAGMFLRSFAQHR